MPTRTPTRKGFGRRRVSPAKKKKKPQQSTFRQKLAAFGGSLRSTLGRQADDVWGLVLVVLSILITLAFLDLAGPIGSGLKSGSTFLFGVWRFAVPFALLGVGLALIIGKPRNGARHLVIGGMTTFIGTLALFHLLTGAVSLRPNIELVQERGGAVGALLAFPLRRVLGMWGAFVVLAASVGMGILIMTQTTVRELFHGIADMWRVGRKRLNEGMASGTKETKVAIAAPSLASKGKHQREKPPKPEVEKTKEEQAPAQTKPKTPVVRTVDLTKTDYQLPPLSLLDGGTGGEVNRRSLEETARQLEDTLLQHGVDATLTKIVPGPTVTRYRDRAGTRRQGESRLKPFPRYRLCTGDAGCPSAGPDPGQVGDRCRSAQHQTPARLSG